MTLEMIAALRDLDATKLAAFAAVVAVVYYVGNAIYNLYFHPLARLPAYGRFAPANTWWSMYRGLVTQDKLHRLHKAHSTYGPIVRYAPNEVVIDDLGALRSIMFARLDKTAAGSGFTTNRGTPNAFSAVVNSEAAGKRKGMLPHYAMNNLYNWQPVFDEHIPQLAQVIRGFGPGQALDVLPLAAHALVDILGEIVLDADIGALYDYAKGFKNPVVTAISLWPKRGVLRGVLPKPVWAVLERLPLGGYWHDLVNSDETLADFVGPRVMSARSREPPERVALVHRLSSSVDTHTGKPWHVDHVISECIDHFLAGTETTSATLALGLYQLSIHHDVLHRLQAELDEAMPDPDTLLDLSTVLKLPYLNAVIKESLRLFPASPAAKMRILKSGLLVQGTFIPPGTVVGVSLWTTHRSERIWGADAQVYRPERWLGTMTPEQTGAFQPFSIGSRSCPGNNLAMADLRFLFSMIARNFELRPARETTPQSMEVKELETIYPIGGSVKLHFIPREL